MRRESEFKSRKIQVEQDRYPQDRQAKRHLVLRGYHWLIGMVFARFK